MYKIFSVFTVLFAFIMISCSFAKSEVNNGELVVSNDYFSFTMPYKTKDTYKVTKDDNGIFIYETVSEKSGLGGFAFGLKIFQNPKDYANAPGVKKIGELTDKKGVIYDMVLIRPTEIQHGNDKKIKEKYECLYDFGETVEIKGVSGSKYYKNQGTKGEELYSEILKKYKTAFTEKWDSDSKYEKADMGYIYYTLVKSNENLSDIIGYTFYDVNFDGIEELFIGRITNGKKKGIIYDMYTMVDRKPTHVVSGGDEDRYFVCDDAFLCNESSLGKNQNSL